MSLRIVLADDHLMVRQAIKAALAQRGLSVTAEASDGQEAITRCQELQPHIAVLDISMPFVNGIDAAREILKLCPNTKIIILSMHQHEKYLQESLRLGIQGYVSKTSTADELANAIRTVAHGETYFSHSFPSAVVSTRTTHDRTERLGVRERQILRLIAEGKNVKEIGSVLNLSENTVRSHRAHIMKKLQVQDTAALVRYSIGGALLEI